MQKYSNDRRSEDRNVSTSRASGRRRDVAILGKAIDVEGADVGAELYGFCAELYPIDRSLTGPGVAATLDLIAKRIPISVNAIASGTAVYDWTVPDVWSFDEAFIENESGERVVDAKRHGLHVVGYSQPVDTWLSLTELRRHVHTLPDKPDLIPYRTNYYAPDWGFCLSHRQAEALPDGRYRAVIRARHAPGNLVWGEYVHRGTSDDEVLLTAHVCHPWLANDNCSGIAVLATLAKLMRGIETRLTYRFLFAPGTIGALCWLSRNERNLHRIVAGLAVSCLGDAGGPTYKRSRRGDTAIDRAMILALTETCPGATIEDFSPYGYDERQYCSPGFDLPFGSLQRSRWGKFPEYHTSADNLDLVKPDELARSIALLAATLDILDGDWTPTSLNPKGEPQLGRRGLYGQTGGDPAAAARNMAMLWTLNLSDGEHTISDMARRSKLPFRDIAAAAAELEHHGLLAERHG